MSTRTYAQRVTFNAKETSLNEKVLATKWLRTLSLDGIDKIRNRLVTDPIEQEQRLYDTHKNFEQLDRYF